MNIPHATMFCIIIEASSMLYFYFIASHLSVTLYTTHYNFEFGQYVFFFTFRFGFLTTK